MLSVDRARTRRLLSERDSLDLVAGRIVDNRSVAMEEIEARIPSAAPTAR